MEKNKTITWLERIFSATTITIILSLATLVLAYFTYIDSKSGDLSIKVNGIAIPINSKSNYVDDIPICIETCVIKMNETDSIIFLDNCAKLPTINNNSNRSIKNVHLEVFMQLTDSINYFYGDEYEPYNNGFKLKSEQIEAFLSVKNPIRIIHIPEKMRHYDNSFLISFNYQISFEGIDQPIQLPYHLALYVYRDDFLGTAEDKKIGVWEIFLNSINDLKNQRRDIKTEEVDGKLYKYDSWDRPYVYTYNDTTIIVNNLKDYINNNKDNNRVFKSIKEFKEHVNSQHSEFSYKKMFFYFLSGLLLLCIIILIFKKKSKQQENQKSKQQESQKSDISIIVNTKSIRAKNEFRYVLTNNYISQERITYTKQNTVLIKVKTINEAEALIKGFKQFHIDAQIIPPK